jgi:hypothetical protein
MRLPSFSHATPSFFIFYILCLLFATLFRADTLVRRFTDLRALSGLLQRLIFQAFPSIELKKTTLF